MNQDPLYRDQTIREVAELTCDAPDAFVGSLAYIVAMYKKPLDAGDHRIETRVETLLGLPLTPIKRRFANALQRFYWQATPENIGRRRGVLFELVLDGLVRPRYTEPSDWACMNAKVGPVRDGEPRIFWDTDADVAAWSQNRQEGEFYSAKVSTSFVEQKHMDVLGKLERHLYEPPATTCVGLWVLTKQTEDALRELQFQKNARCPENVQLCGYERLARLKVDMPRPPQPS